MSASAGTSVSLRDQLQQSLGRDVTIERELGGGGMSRVFLAEDTTLGRKIVLKVLPPEFTAGVSVERFNREILLAARLQHPHIVPVLSAGSMNGQPWYAMPFVEGESLRARLDRGSLSITESVGLLRDIARALSYAHARGIVHRDIKPGNVLLTGGSAAVTDFGIAKAISASRTEGGAESLTQTGTGIGTPLYMAPEQSAGDRETDHRADIYSLGCLAYEVLAGRPPFAGKSPQQLLTAHMAETPQSILELRPDTPATLADVVMRCLEKDASDRPQSADEIVRVLEDVSGTLLGAAGMFRNALLIYAMSFGAVAISAKAAIVGIGLPTWVFPGALIVMALGLPVILWTGYVDHVTSQALTSRFTPSGAGAVARSPMATIALKASPHMSWRRTAQGGMISMAVFTLLIGGFMILRALGIGPEGSLLAAGAIAPRDRIMMTDFTVNGTDSALGRVVSDAVRAGLVESPVLTLMTPGQVNTVLRLMERPVTSYMDLALARELGQRAGVKAIVDGDVTLVGSSYFLAVRLVTADSGKELMSYRGTAARPEAIIDVTDELTRKLRARAGESLRAVNGAPHLALVTTASLPALRKFSEAVRLMGIGEDRKAIRLLREAVEIDTLFASAWRRLGVAMQNLGMPASARDSAHSRAFALRRRFTEQQLPLFLATYYFSGPGRDREKAIDIYNRMLTRGDTDGVLQNLAILVSYRREFARAETLSRAQVRRSPNGSLEGLLSNLLRRGKWAESDSVLAVALVRFAGNTRYNEYMLEQLQDRGEWDAYRRGVDSALRVPDPRNPNGAVFRAATLAFAEGRPRDADALLAEVFRIDSTANLAYVDRYAGSYEVMVPAMARTETPLFQRVSAQLPHAAELRAYESQLAKTSLSALSDADVPFLPMAAWFARAGNAPRARAALDQYRREVSDTSVLRVQQPGLHAALGEIANAEGRWEEATREMRLADSRPDGPADNCAHCLSLKLFRVFATAGMTDSALAQYEAYRRSTLGSRPRNGRDPNIAAPALETVGRMYEQRGDTARAVEAYRGFVERWKRADAEFQPRVDAARRRIAALSAVERPRR